jgi:predicted component of type VI protein secretion system
VAVFHAVEGPFKGQVFKIPSKPKLIVGRYEIHDLIISDPSMSRKHFALEKRPDGMYLVDLGSLNGTQLNGTRVSTAKLTQGDRITAGQTMLAWDEADGATPPPAPVVVGPAPGEEEPIESISEEDILEEPGVEEVFPDEGPAPGKGPVPPATVALDLSKEIAKKEERAAREPREPREAPPRGGRRRGARARASREKPSREKDAKEKRPKKAEECAACGRKVTAEEADAGEGAQSRLGYVCGRCLEIRQKSGRRGSLEKFIRERQRRRKR